MTATGLSSFSGTPGGSVSYANPQMHCYEERSFTFISLFVDSLVFCPKNSEGLVSVNTDPFGLTYCTLQLSNPDPITCGD